MTLEPPQPPTAPAPALRPTPPKPPRIDKTPFAKDSADDSSTQGDNPQAQREVTTPEDMARDAVAHGSGALTKRTVDNGDEPQVTTPAPQSTPRQEVPLPADTQSDYDRGQDVLREFRNLDNQQPTENLPAHTSTESTTPHVPKLHYDEGHGAIYWLFTIFFVVVAAFVIVKKFLLTDKPALTKAELFEDSSSKLKAAADKVKPVTPPPKPIKLPPKKSDDDKPKHFEVRV